MLNYVYPRIKIEIIPLSRIITISVFLLIYKNIYFFQYLIKLYTTIHELFSFILFCQSNKILFISAKHWFYSIIEIIVTSPYQCPVINALL